MTNLFRPASKAALLSQPQRFFATPEAAGRKITCGFTHLQRISKEAATDLWFSDAVKQSVAERIAAGDASVLNEFRAEWAAVRQFELLQEAGNLAVDDLRTEDFKKAFQYLMKMRGGGYRITVVTLGRYVEPSAHDDLRILDRRMQDEITRLIHMLYLDEHSAALTAGHRRTLGTGNWNCADALPHVAETLGVRNLFAKSPNGRNQKMTDGFFRLLELLPQRHIVHDVAVGLTLPESTAEKHWIYLAKGEHRFTEFQNAMNTMFRGFDHVSLGGMPEHKIKPAMHHMRAYGDRMSPAAEAANRESAKLVWQTTAPRKLH